MHFELLFNKYNQLNLYIFTLCLNYTNLSKISSTVFYKFNHISEIFKYHILIKKDLSLLYYIPGIELISLVDQVNNDHIFL